VRLSLAVPLGFFLVVGLAAFAVLGIFAREVRPGVRQGMEVALVDTAHLLAELAAADLEAGTLDRGPFAAAVARYRLREPRARIWGLHKRRTEFRVYVTDARGRLLYDSAGDAPGTDYAAWNDVRLTLQGGYGVRSTRTVPGDPSTSSMVVAAPVLVGGRLRGVLSVVTPTASVQPFAQRSERHVLRAGMILVGVSALVGLGLTLWLTLGIGRLRAYARAVAEGRKASLPAQGGELGELGRALETMRERLEGRSHLESWIHKLTHELKSPLAGIHGALELLEDDLPEADRRRFLDHIRDQEARLQRITGRLLDLALVQHRQRLEAPVPLDPAALLERVLAAREPLLTAKGLRVAFRPGAPVRVLGEAFLLEQALANLVDNALEFSPQGGLLAVAVEAGQGAPGQAPATDVPEGPAVVLCVRDEGPGLPDFALDRVFEPFYSLARPDTGRKSTGLGLAFAREVAELHRGTLSLANRPGGGAEARLVLPTC
jgi:two-component system, OmpR family, sensor histidine kinase CreC